MWGEPTETEQLELIKKQLQGIMVWTDSLQIENKQLKEELKEWKELFLLLKSDHELLENFQTQEWKEKARKMGIQLY